VQQEAIAFEAEVLQELGELGGTSVSVKTVINSDDFNKWYYDFKEIITIATDIVLTDEQSVYNMMNDAINDAYRHGREDAEEKAHLGEKAASLRAQIAKSEAERDEAVAAAERHKAASEFCKNREQSLNKGKGLEGIMEAIITFAKLREDGHVTSEEFLEFIGEARHVIKSHSETIRAVLSRFSYFF
jgi:hypothetical protein